MILGLIMKRVLLLSIILSYALVSPGQIIADHTVVDKYVDIPQYYIDKVKQMWLSYPGESHSEAVRIGMGLLEALDPKYSVSVYNSGNPEAYTPDHLRVSSVAWGDVDTPTGWIYYPAGGGYGEEDWFLTSAAVSQTKSGISYSNSGGLNLSAFGFCWCWDGDVYNISFTNLYIAATQSYIEYCRAKGYSTKVFFTTGPVDTMTEGLGWFKYLQYEAIRDSVSNDKTRMLFDFADILCYDDGKDIPNTRNWNGHIYPWITPTNYGDGSVAHMNNAGCLRLAKAMWWMLARIAGWNGISTDIDIPEEVEDSPQIMISDEEVKIFFYEPASWKAVSLYSLQGKLIDVRNNIKETCVFKTAHLPSGIYLFVFSASDQSLKSKKVFIP